MTQPLPRLWYVEYCLALAKYMPWQSSTKISTEEDMRRHHHNVRTDLDWLIKDIREDQERLTPRLSPAQYELLSNAIISLKGRYAAHEFVEGLFAQSLFDSSTKSWRGGYVLARIGLAVVIEEAKTKLLLLEEGPAL